MFLTNHPYYVACVRIGFEVDRMADFGRRMWVPLAFRHPWNLKETTPWGAPCYEDYFISSCWNRLTEIPSSRFARDQRGSVGEKALGYPSPMFTGKGFVNKICPEVSKRAYSARSTIT